MPRYPKDLVELIAEKTHRNILRLLLDGDGLISAEIGRKLEDAARIRFKSTSSLTEALQRLVKQGLLKKVGSKYYLSERAKERWVVRFLDLLVKEKIDKGKPTSLHLSKD